MEGMDTAEWTLGGRNLRASRDPSQFSKNNAGLAVHSGLTTYQAESPPFLCIHVFKWLG
jgi:hypothetical protein